MRAAHDSISRLGRLCKAGRICVLLALLAAACRPAPDAAPQAEKTPPALELTTLASGAALGDRPAEPYFALLDEAALPQAQDRLPAEAFEAARAALAVDSRPLLAAYAGRRGSSGYTVEIRSATWQDGQLVVRVHEARPEPNQIVEPAFTLPYHIVRVDLSSLGEPLPSPLRYVFIDEHNQIIQQGETTSLDIQKP